MQDPEPVSAPPSWEVSPSACPAPVVSGSPELSLPEIEEAPEQDEWRSQCPDSQLLETRLQEHFQKILVFLREPAQRLSFFETEQILIGLIQTLGRLCLALVLCYRHEGLEIPRSEIRQGRTYRRRGLQSRLLGTFFGKVRYWRTYLHAKGGGYYPLDEQLRLPAGGFSFHLSSLMARLATRMSYGQAVVLLRCFLGWSPCHATAERTIFALARHTSSFFEQVGVPEDDGEVMVIMIDSKATPTATEEELSKRRGKRKPAGISGSPRHRGRLRRQRRGRKKRRKKGDKSKNGKMATLVVMYTLRPGEDQDGRPILVGPIHKRIYASYAPKRHAFAVARREANRRGFHQDSGKTLQLVTDGDPDLSYYAKKYFPEAIHTLDVIHAVEALWKAGRSLYREGSDELGQWVELQKDRLYDGQIQAILDELTQILDALPKTGPGNKGKRERLEQTFNYLNKRVSMMNYPELLAADLEISTGPAEGAVRYVIAQRFDEGGMRWIKESAEALLQLRCIEINGEWDKFMRFVHAQGWTDSSNAVPRGVDLQLSTPDPLPTYGLDG